MELDYYPLKSAAAKIGCIEEDLISLAAEDKLSIYFKLGGRAILEMDYGCPDDWGEIAFYSLPPLKIYASTLERYQSDPSALLSQGINPKDPENPGYCLKESVPLKDATLFVSAEDVARLSQSGDYRGSKRDEPDYYPLTMAAEITGYTKDYLICLAADNKLPFYVKLGGKEAWALGSHFENGDSPDFCYLPTICKVWASTIVKYQSDPSVLLFGLSPLDDDPAINCYNLKDKIPLKDITLFVSAEDMAWLSKKKNDSAGSQESTDPIRTKVIQAETTGDANVIIHDDGWQDDPTLTKRKKQHKAILKVITLKKFDPMAIPDGGKGTIQKICEIDYPLLFDGDTSFDNAWKKGRELFCMANHASYAKRGK